MSAYQVLSAEETGRLPAKDGRPELAIHVYQLQGVGKPVKRFPKAGSPLEQVGATVEWELEEKNYGFKANLPQRNGGGGGFSGGGGRSQTHPEDARRMGRCHAQDMAMLYIREKRELGKISDFTFDEVVKIADRFEADVDQTLPPLPSDVPADTQGLPTVDDVLAENTDDTPF